MTDTSARDDRGPEKAVKRQKVLIVDDELDLRIFISALFKIGGYLPIATRDGQEGLRKARECSPALIILDVMMPGEGGVQMYRKLKTDSVLKKIPVIMLSAVTEDTFRHYLKMLNVRIAPPLPEPDVYLEKPPDARELLAVAEKLMGPQRGPGGRRGGTAPT